MAHAYQAVGWNRQKRRYDGALALTLGLGAVVYGLTVCLRWPDTTPETLIIRLTAISALVLLHVILAIGPLARLDARFLPLLYNRRHLGVTMFLLGLVHGTFAIIQFNAGGDLNPLVGVLTAYSQDYSAFIETPRYLAHFPFEVFGLGALVIFFVMAATSHDFWLSNLGPSFWKLMHMGVYAAYGLVLLHVFYGALQAEQNPFYPVALGAGFILLVTLHFAAYRKEQRRDRQKSAAAEAGFVRAAQAKELREGRGHIVMMDGERIALFLREGRVFALSNVCRHQGGPLGEGKIVDGCLTCPWHGYQYRVEDGCSPPPFTEVVPTYMVKVIGEEIYVSANPLALGQKSAGENVSAVTPTAEEEFYIGWQGRMPRGLGRRIGTTCATLLVAVPAVMFGVAWLENPVDAGAYEFGVERTFAGVLHENPIPLLEVKATPTAGGFNYLLVGAGKFGPPEVIRGHEGQSVRFQGSLIYRNGVAMIEMNEPATFTVTDATRAEPEPVVQLGRAALTGELVDTKCFFGAMRPATGKVHQACAIRCLSGGVPPGLLVIDAAGNGVVVLLAGPAGQPLDFDVQWAARTIRAEGELEMDSGTPILRVSSLTLAD
ncbi:MAG: Rieske 2Fe-2S domain-containing protein [Opitutales bacterium]|jgi:nitrite reductase/ring-hydroxylating ferredoxin subunit